MIPGRVKKILLPKFPHKLLLREKGPQPLPRKPVKLNVYLFISALDNLHKKQEVRFIFLSPPVKRLRLVFAVEKSRT